MVPLFLTSCKEDIKDVEINFIGTLIKEINVDLGYKWIVILPGLGCEGCIQEGEVFMKDFINDKNILFVLTKIESLKILKQKIGVNIHKHDNIFLDKKGLFDIPTKNKIYPCIIEMKDGKVVSYGFQSPGNSQAFKELKAHISN